MPTPAAGGTLNLLTYNVGFMRIALLGIVFYQPAAFVDERFAWLPEALLSSGADIITLQEAFGSDRKETLAAAVRAGQIRQVLAAAARPFDGVTTLLGNLNAGPDASDENYQLVLDTGYVDVFAAATGDSAAADHLTWDPRQLLITNGPRRHTVPRRTDHVFLPSVEEERIAIEGVRIVFKKNAVPVEGAGRVPVSDHYGVQVQLRFLGR